MSDKITVRLSAHEQKMFEAIRRGNRSDTVRDLIRREFRRTFWRRHLDRGCFHAGGLSVSLEVKRDG